MGRPKGSKNKPKDEETPPEAGHNSALTESEKRALFIQGISELESLLDKKSKAVADVRNQRKRIISFGFKPFEIDFALQLRKDEDDSMIDRRRQEAKIAQFLNHPIGTQLDWVDAVDRTPSVDIAYENGKIAGAAGHTAKSPHSPGTDQDQSWLKGWHEAQDDLSSGFKKLEAGAVDEDEMEAA